MTRKKNQIIDIEKIEKKEQKMNQEFPTNLSSQEAMAILQREQQERVRQCSKDINDILAKHRCTFDVSMILRQGSIVPNIQVIAIPEQQMDQSMLS